ncbi:MAG: hypothetical protein ABI678_10300 [Kofleriaceae bacterium]
MVSRSGLAVSFCVLWTASGHAQPKPNPAPVPKERVAPVAKVTTPLIGATEVVKYTAPVGFIDDAITFDDQRLAYVVADGSTKTELHVVGGAPADTVVDLGAITTHPLTLRLIGPRVFVTGLNANNDQIAALVELATGKPVYKLGPATHITVITRDGKPRIAIHRQTGGKHEVEVDALETGKRIAAGRAFELDDKGVNKATDFRVNHWSDGWTKAYGIKGGELDRKENQRTADTEATFDLVTGKVSDRHPITDLFEQRKRFQVLESAKADASIDFVRMSWDNSSITEWRGGKALPITLDQNLAQYDPKSLQGILDADGSAWIALAVDPVNAEAVARKKADPAYFDIFKAGSDGKAVRKARVLATGVRERLGVIRDKLYLLERSAGFDRGGKTLTIYAIN